MQALPGFCELTLGIVLNCLGVVLGLEVLVAVILERLGVFSSGLGRARRLRAMRRGNGQVAVALLLLGSVHSFGSTVC